MGSNLGISFVAFIQSSSAARMAATRLPSEEPGDDHKSAVWRHAVRLPMPLLQHSSPSQARAAVSGPPDTISVFSFSKA